jgi:hypothetical protein
LHLLRQVPNLSVHWVGLLQPDGHIIHRFAGGVPALPDLHLHTG